MLKNRMTILVVDDEADIREAIKDTLEKEYDVLTAASSEEALALCDRHNPSLIISDYNMPGGNGLLFCQAVRTSEKISEIPFLILSGQADEGLRVESFVNGVDDYIQKPVSLRELHARIKSKLKWQRSLMNDSHNKDELHCGNLAINHKRGEVSLGSKMIDLTSFEIKLLTYFIENKTHKLKRDDILMDVWAPHIVSGRTVDAHICALRHKLAGFDHVFETIRGFGYQLVSVKYSQVRGVQGL